MSQTQKIYPTQDTVSPHTSELYSYAVRIELSDLPNEPRLLGSGILYCQEGVFKVFTAGHCLFIDSDDLYPVDKLAFSFAEEKSSAFKAIKILEINKEEDYAIIEVDYAPIQYKIEDYKDSPVFIGRPFGRQTSIYGFSRTYPSGRNFEVEYVAPNTYSIKAPILASGLDLEMIRGFSGAGVYTKFGDRIFCEGFIKSKFESSERLEEIVVGKIPDLGDGWFENYNNDLSGTPYISSGNNAAKVEYMDAWRSLFHKIRRGENCAAELNSVMEKKQTYPFSKNDSFQEQTIWYLFRKESDWREDERKAFLLALRDLGHWPSLYGNIPERAGNLIKHPDCLILSHRAATLFSDEDLEPVALDLNNDSDIYESIIRKMFRFDFAPALEQCKKWVPTDESFVAKKLMLLHLWGIKDASAIEFLENRIKEMPDGIERAFIETAIANQCDFQIPSKYSYEPFNKAGLDSPGEVLSFILEKIDVKKEKIQVYGTYTKEILLPDDNTSFPSALRVINYLIDSGIPTSDGFVWTVAKEKWLKVFRHLFRNFPYPLVFYTLLYRDEKLARRTGQEMAYTDDEEFRSKLPEIMIALLKSLTLDSTPNIIISPIFMICGELFCSLGSEIWFHEFINVIKVYFDKSNISSLSHRDEFYKFMEKGISGIRTDGERIELFSTMSHYLVANPILVSRLLSHTVHFENGFVPDAVFEKVMTDILNTISYKQILPLIAQLSFSNLLTEAQKQMIYNAVQLEGLDYAEGDPDALHYLSFIVTDAKTVEELKRHILQLNIWECGISENGNSFHSAEGFAIENISSKIIWSHEEENVIIGNLDNNLSLIEKIENIGKFHGFIMSSTSSLLSRMSHYIADENIASNHDVSRLKNRLEKQIEKWSDSESLLERLSGQSYDVVSDATREVLTLAENTGIKEQEVEIGTLINRALTKNKTALPIIIDAVSFLTKKWPHEMNEYFGNQLLILLKVYCRYDYEELELCVPFVNRSLISIAEALRKHYPDSAAIKYWTSEEIHNRFCYK